ncbi:MAG: nuclear transport factor 2 family protein [Bacteroidetes bacterium]|nr:nuclear transport factor 2 family protein [Bacteroidota bacterium]
MSIKYVFSTFLALTLYTSGHCQNLTDDEIKTEAWNTVKTINRHWAITENMDSLGLFIHPDMVIFLPDTPERMRGKASIIESYQSYANYAQTISFIETDPLIQLYNENKTAVVTYYYTLEFLTSAGETRRFNGRDMYTFIYDNGRWVAVAQQYTQIPD